MKRREFITLLGGAAVTWPPAARGQQPEMPVIGFLRSAEFANVSHFVTAFRRGLKEVEFVEGQNVMIEFRSAEDRPDRLPALATDLIRRPVALIVGDLPSAIAAKAATTTVPIVFATGADPVTEGLVASLNRPGGNVTGVVFFNAVLGAKRLELLRQLVPKVTTNGVLVYPNNPSGADQSISLGALKLGELPLPAPREIAYFYAHTEAERREVQAAAQAVGQQLFILDVSSDRDIETAFTTIVQRGAGALLVGTGAFLNSHRERLVALAAHHGLPASYGWREAVVAGGLMSYGASITDAYRQAGIYAGRILKGERPADLPVMRSTKIEFVINLRTAKALGLDVPDKLLAIADEVIE